MKQSVFEDFINILLDISRNPGISQRTLALRNGISLGKVNSAIKYFQNQGFLEVHSVTDNNNRKKYLYRLTSAGKLVQTEHVLESIQLKKKEYERIARDLKELEDDVIKQLDHRITAEVGKN